MFNLKSNMLSKLIFTNKNKELIVNITRIFANNYISKKLSFNNNVHPFHIVQSSPYPYILSWAIAGLVVILILKLNGSVTQGGNCPFLIALYLTSRWAFTVSLIGWFWDIILEATFEGRHTFAVQKNIRFGFILFIVSEVIFFASFFFSYFYLAVWPSVELGFIWPPIGLKTINPWSLPLVNTFILLASGVSVTWSHKALSRQFNDQIPLGSTMYIEEQPITENTFSLAKYIRSYRYPKLWIKGYKLLETPVYDIEKDIEFTAFDLKKPVLKDIKTYISVYDNSLTYEKPWEFNIKQTVEESLLLTIFLGCVFTIIQVYEYKQSNFSIGTTVYGSLFFLITGFHGLHVIIGTLILFICLLRVINYHFTRDHHLGFELAIRYWHFVDVVWIFLFLCLYWWGA